MSQLTSKQRAHLRRLAHKLKPVVHVGAGGVTPAVLQAVEEAFNTRELIKVKALESAPDRIRALADEVVANLEDVHPVQTIGRTAVLYRPHPDDPDITLPPHND